MKIEKEKILEIPFRDGIVQKIQVAHIVDDAGVKLFRYTRSMEYVRARYRITVQFSDDETYTPYVFDVVRPNPDAMLEIRPDSDTAREIWKDDTEVKKQELQGALNLIYERDIEEGLKSGA